MLKRTIETIRNIELPYLDEERLVLVRRVARLAWLEGARYAADEVRAGRLPSEAVEDAKAQVCEDERAQEVAGG